jgi:hypothetical protein
MIGSRRLKEIPGAETKVDRLQGFSRRMKENNC